MAGGVRDPYVGFVGLYGSWVSGVVGFRGLGPQAGLGFRFQGLGFRGLGYEGDMSFCRAGLVSMVVCATGCVTVIRNHTP